MNSLRPDVQIAILAKAPIAGLAKTRLTPAIGAEGAARLQATLTDHTVRTALEANIGAVHLWCAPDNEHPHFRRIQLNYQIPCLNQVEGDLGVRMLAAFTQHCTSGPVVLIGTDCPALDAEHLCDAARVLTDGHDAVFQPAEDGGYVLIGLRHPCPPLFENMPWSTQEVMTQTRQRASRQGLRWAELPMLWDVDEPPDLERLRRSASLSHLLSEP